MMNNSTNSYGVKTIEFETMLKESFERTGKMNEASQKYADFIAEQYSERREDNDKINNPGQDDMVNHPPHYTDGGIEVIDFIKAKNLDFCLGNAVKYISRSGKKTDAGMTDKAKTIQDLEKAIWYCKKEIEWLRSE